MSAKLNMGMFDQAIDRLIDALAGAVKSGADATKIVETFGEGCKTAATHVNNLTQAQEKTDSLIKSISKKRKADVAAANELDKARLKTIDDLGKKYQELESKYASLASSQAKDSKAMGENFKASVKTMADAMQQAFSSGKKNSIGEFFKAQFSGLNETIRKELSNIKVNTVNVGVDIGKSIQEGIGSGVKKGGKGGKSSGIADLLNKAIQADINSAIDGVSATVKTLAAKSGIVLGEAFDKSMAGLKKATGNKKKISLYNDIVNFGGTEEKAAVQKQFTDSLKNIQAYQSQVEKMSAKHGIELTQKQKERLLNMENFNKQAQQAAARGMSGSDIKGNLVDVQGFEKLSKLMTLEQRRSLEASTKNTEINKQRKMLKHNIK